MTTVAIHQPNFFPWIGYFEKIAHCDYFVFLDDVQYSKGTMINRTLIPDKRRDMWLTCPVHYKHPAKIRDVMIADDHPWSAKMIRTLEYKYFPELAGKIINIFLETICHNESNLSKFNIYNIMYMSSLLGIQPKKGFVIQSELGEFTSKKTDLIVDIVGYLGGDSYYSGIGSIKYLDVEKMKDCGIDVEFQKTMDFPIYSIFDLLFTEGVDGIKEKGWLR